MCGSCSVVDVCSEACAIEQSPLGGACDSTGVDPAAGVCVCVYVCVCVCVCVCV